MKKIAILITAMLIFSQLSAQLPFTFGPKVGFTTTKLTTNKAEIKEAFAANLHGGVFLRFGKKSYFQPEVNFTSKGGLFSNNQLLPAREIQLNTVEIPLLFGAKVINGGAANFRLMFGPSISFVVDKTIDMRNGHDKIDTGLFRDAMWGVQGGVGIDVLMLSLDIRYELGLNNLSELDGIEMKNSLFNVSLGWKIL